MEKIRIILADDHTILREGIKALLEKQGNIEVGAEASNGQEAVSKVSQFQPDVVVLDISMPVMEGLEATRQMKRVAPDVKILILTMYDDSEYFFRLLHAGASGYVTKKAVGKDLITAIEAVYNGESFFCPSMSKSLLSDYLRLLKILRKLNRKDSHRANGR